MSYSIKIVDINDPGVDLAIRCLVKATYDYPSLLPEKYLAANINSKASRPGFFLVAEENDEIIGCNGFLPNDFSLNGKQYVGYQSCWTSVLPSQQGKNVFSDLINEAKKILKEQGVGFLYGIANDRSNPIMKNKLGFTEIPAMVSWIPNMPFLKHSFIKKAIALNKNNACMINEEQVKSHKEAQSPSLLKVVRVNDSWLWGKLIHKKKFGFNIPVFYVGGIELAAEADLDKLVAQVFHLQKAWFVQFFSCSTNTFNCLLKRWRKPKKMNGFVFYNLNMPAFDHLNLMIGVLDVF